MLTQETIESIKQAKKDAALDKEMIASCGLVYGIRHWVNFDHPSPWFVSLSPQEYTEKNKSHINSKMFNDFFRESSLYEKPAKRTSKKQRLGGS